MRRKLLVLMLISIFALSIQAYAAPVTIELWDNPAQVMNTYMQGVIGVWNKANPNIQVKYTIIPGNGIEPWLKIGTALAAGEAADIVSSHIRFADDWAFAGLVAPIPSSVISDSEIKARFPSFVAKEYKWDIEEMKTGSGEYYILPIRTQCPVLYLNRDLFKKAGLDPAIMRDNLTWDKLVEMAKKLTIRDKNGRLLQAGYTAEGHAWVWWEAIAYSLGGHKYKPANNKSGFASNADSKEFVQALELTARLWRTEKLYDPGFLNWVDAFGTGKAAMVAGWGWAGYFFKENYPDIDFEGVAMPTFSGKPPYGTQRPAENYIVPSDKGNKKFNDRKDATWKFFKEVLLRTDVVDRLTYSLYCIPIYKPVLENKDLMAKYLRDSTMAAQLKEYPRSVFVGDEINEDFEYAIELEDNLLYKNATVKDAIKVFVDKMNHVLSDRFCRVTPEG